LRRSIKRAKLCTPVFGFLTDAREILVELGDRRMVGGQEDMIVDVALDLLKEKEANGA